MRVIGQEGQVFDRGSRPGQGRVSVVTSELGCEDAGSWPHKEPVEKPSEHL